MTGRLASVSSRLFVSLCLAGLGGCGLVQTVSDGATSVAASPAVQATGMVHGGQQPITGTTIQLYAVGTTGYGSTPSLLTAGTLTSSDGSGLPNSNANAGNANNTLPAGFFTITGAYSCPVSNPLVYLLATGGNPGLTAGTNNSAIVMMAALGACNSLSSSKFVTVNEVTTVASVYALAQFMNSSGNVGDITGTSTGVINAFANVNNLVNLTTGSALLTDSAGNAVPQSEINTIADIVVPCVNSTGPTSSACSTLISDTFPAVNPQTVLAIVYRLALNPNLSGSTLLNLSNTNAAFQPTLSTAPHNWSLTVGGSSSICGYSGSGYTVSGTVAYSGASTGRTYLALTNNTCSAAGTFGTSVSTSGAYSIRGVPPGNYTLSAFMDNLGYGAQNVANPSGSSAVTLAGTSNIGNQNVTLVDPLTPTVTSAPSLNSVGGLNTGAFALYNPIKNNGVEAATSYTLQWSTSQTFTTVAGSQSFPATGTGGSNVWLVNGLSNGSIYYFRAYGSSAGTAVGPYSPVYGPVTIGAPTSGSSVSGTVTFSGTATGPMYAGVYNQYTNMAYGQYIANPASPQAYSVVAPNSASAVYTPFAIIDQNNNGVVDTGDIDNVNDNGNSSIPISVTGPVTNQNMTLSSSSSTGTAVTQTLLAGGNQSYSFQIQVVGLLKLPVAVTLQSSSNSDGANVTGPMDIALCTNNGCGKGFQMSFNLAASPTVGDTYFFNVAYSDGTSGVLTAALTGVLTNFATNLAPTTGTSTTPTFSWTNPVCTLCSSYYYQFYLSTLTGGQIWGVPDNVNSLPYTTTSLVWGVDPTDSGNMPSVSSLTLGVTYVWTITVQDANGNQASTQVSYTP